MVIYFLSPKTDTRFQRLHGKGPNAEHSPFCSSSAGYFVMSQAQTFKKNFKTFRMQGSRVAGTSFIRTTPAFQDIPNFEYRETGYTSHRIKRNPANTECVTPHSNTSPHRFNALSTGFLGPSAKLDETCACGMTYFVDRAKYFLENTTQNKFLHLLSSLNSPRTRRGVVRA